MARYQKKGPERYSEAIKIPIPAYVLTRIREVAVTMHVTPTELARRVLIDGLQRVSK